MIIAAKVGRHGRITLPREVREQLRLREGDKVLFQLKDDMTIEVRRIKPLLELRGSIPVDGPQDLDLVREKALELYIRERFTDGADEPDCFMRDI